MSEDRAGAGDSFCYILHSIVRIYQFFAVLTFERKVGRRSNCFKGEPIFKEYSFFFLSNMSSQMWVENREGEKCKTMDDFRD